VNSWVNGHVVQRTDIENYHVDELWRRSGIERGATGDCEDIAIEKRYQLVDAGFSPERLSFAVVYQRSTGFHTVLIARTTRGDHVLDSRSGFVTIWNKTPYSWISVQSTQDPMVWRTVASVTGQSI
jgi:predicted transglutaminase-like cysteine proteinase